MSALMNECAHGSDGSYRDESVPGCPYCEIDRLRAALERIAKLECGVGEPCLMAFIIAREALRGGECPSSP